MTFLEPKMTSDGFVAFWRSVQNIPNIKSSYIGPVLEQLMGQKRGCSVFRRILLFNLGFCLLGFVWWLSKYIAWPSTVFGTLSFMQFWRQRSARVLKIFYLKVLSIIFLNIFSMVLIMNMSN